MNFTVVVVFQYHYLMRTMMKREYNTVILIYRRNRAIRAVMNVASHKFGFKLQTKAETFFDM